MAISNIKINWKHPHNELIKEKKEETTIIREPVTLPACDWKAVFVFCIVVGCAGQFYLCLAWHALNRLGYCVVCQLYIDIVCNILVLLDLWTMWDMGKITDLPK